MSPRKPPDKPLHKEVAEFVIFHLADKSAFSPFTGTDYSAWHAYIYLVRLWGRTRSDDVAAAMRAVVHTAQVRNHDVMAVFKKSIPCLLDWSDEPKLWSQIGPMADVDELAQARAKAGLDGGKIVAAVQWPCSDGARICEHDNSRPYKRSSEPGWLDCKDCGAIWKPASVIGHQQ